jgi:hypothetical protein
MKLLAELLFHSSYDRATQERLIGPLSKIVVAWIQRSHEGYSEIEAFGLGIQAAPTDLYHDGEHVYLLTHALFERGNPSPSDVRIYVAPRGCIEEQLSKMKIAAYQNKADRKRRARPQLTTGLEVRKWNRRHLCKCRRQTNIMRLQTLRMLVTSRRPKLVFRHSCQYLIECLLTPREPQLRRSAQDRQRRGQVFRTGILIRTVYRARSCPRAWGEVDVCFDKGEQCSLGACLAAIRAYRREFYRSSSAHRGADFLDDRCCSPRQWLEGSNSTSSHASSPKSKCLWRNLENR